MLGIGKNLGRQGLGRRISGYLGIPRNSRCWALTHILAYGIRKSADLRISCAQLALSHWEEIFQGAKYRCLVRVRASYNHSLTGIPKRPTWEPKAAKFTAFTRQLHSIICIGTADLQVSHCSFISAGMGGASMLGANWELRDHSFCCYFQAQISST